MEQLAVLIVDKSHLRRLGNQPGIHESVKAESLRKRNADGKHQQVSKEDDKRQALMCIGRVLEVLLVLPHTHSAGNQGHQSVGVKVEEERFVQPYLQENRRNEKCSEIGNWNHAEDDLLDRKSVV